MAATVYAERRTRALEAIPGGVAIVPSARTILRNNDTAFPFRQNSDFFYLTGFNEPDALLVLSPQAPQRSTLFLRTRDRDLEVWDGHRLGVERACEHLGVDAAYPIGELAQRLPELLVGSTALYFGFGKDEAMDRTIYDALSAARAKARQEGKVPQTFVDPALILHELRLIKSEAEIATMRKGAEITRNGFTTAMRNSRPGLYEYEIQAMMEAEYRRCGAQSLAYESIVAGGDNATTLHYVANRDQLEPGTLLLVDSGCELDYYATDVTRTWPVEGRFTAEQRAVYDVVLAAQEAAIQTVRAGTARSIFHDTAIRTITQGLIDLGLLTGSLDENIERKHYREYYMHGTGHWLGLDVHDVGATRDAEDKPVLFRPGMVTTVEPGIYVRRDADCPDRFKGIGVRIEDDILVTPYGNENLTHEIPKRADELEAVVGSDISTATLAR